MTEQLMPLGTRTTEGSTLLGHITLYRWSAKLRRGHLRTQKPSVQFLNVSGLVLAGHREGDNSYVTLLIVTKQGTVLI
jgi:hypothetical protein